MFSALHQLARMGWPDQRCHGYSRHGQAGMAGGVLFYLIHAPTVPQKGYTAQPLSR